ncbi:uncharacterized protein METZ01_LOCUS141673, partial [marine metagenome]
MASLSRQLKSGRYSRGEVRVENTRWPSPRVTVLVFATY